MFECMKNKKSYGGFTPYHSSYPPHPPSYVNVFKYHCGLPGSRHNVYGHNISIRVHKIFCFFNQIFKAGLLVTALYLVFFVFCLNAGIFVLESGGVKIRAVFAGNIISNLRRESRDKDRGFTRTQCVP